MIFSSKKSGKTSANKMSLRSAIQKLISGQANDLYEGRRISLAVMTGRCSYPIPLESLLDKRTCFRLKRGTCVQIPSCSCPPVDDVLELPNLSFLSSEKRTWLNRNMMTIALGCSKNQDATGASDLLYRMKDLPALAYLQIWMTTNLNIKPQNVLLQYSESKETFMVHFVFGHTVELCKCLVRQLCDFCTRCRIVGGFSYSRSPFNRMILTLASKVRNGKEEESDRNAFLHSMQKHYEEENIRLDANEIQQWSRITKIVDIEQILDLLQGDI